MDNTEFTKQEKIKALSQHILEECVQQGLTICEVRALLTQLDIDYTTAVTKNNRIECFKYLT